MTDRFNALTVVLDHDVRDDDAQRVMDAISCLQGVLSVQGNVTDLTDHVAHERARREISTRLWEALLADA